MERKTDMQRVEALSRSVFVLNTEISECTEDYHGIVCPFIALPRGLLSREELQVPLRVDVAIVLWASCSFYPQKRG